MGFVHLAIDRTQELNRLFVEEVAETVQQAKLRDSKARIGLSGGSVATEFLPALRDSEVDKTKIEVFWCDERAVPLDHVQSNYRSARELWLSDGQVPQSQIHPLGAEPTLEAAARRYEKILDLGEGSPLDLALLGAGPDGHIASLFPQSPLLESENWVEPVFDSPKPPPRRLTMTLKLLTASRRIVIAAFGQEKAEAIAQSLTPNSRLPLARLLQRSAQTLLLLTPAAAARIPRSVRQKMGCRLATPT